MKAFAICMLTIGTLLPFNAIAENATGPTQQATLVDDCSFSYSSGWLFAPKCTVSCPKKPDTKHKVKTKAACKAACQTRAAGLYGGLAADYCNTAGGGGAEEDEDTGQVPIDSIDR